MLGPTGSRERLREEWCRGRHLLHWTKNDLSPSNIVAALTRRGNVAYRREASQPSDGRFWVVSLHQVGSAQITAAMVAANMDERGIGNVGSTESIERVVRCPQHQQPRRTSSGVRPSCSARARCSSKACSESGPRKAAKSASTRCRSSSIGLFAGGVVFARVALLGFVFDLGLFFAGRLFFIGWAFEQELVLRRRTRREPPQPSPP